MSSRVFITSLQTPHYFSTTRDDKVNDCGFKFSAVCKWHVSFKEDKDDSLQFAKVFPAKFLKLVIRQFSHATILRYTVYVRVCFISRVTCIP